MLISKPEGSFGALTLPVNRVLVVSYRQLGILFCVLQKNVDTSWNNVAIGLTVVIR